MEQLLFYGTDLFYLCVADRLCCHILRSKVETKKKIIWVLICLIGCDVISYQYIRMGLFVIVAGILWNYGISLVLYEGMVKRRMFLMVGLSLGHLSVLCLFGWLIALLSGEWKSASGFRSASGLRSAFGLWSASGLKSALFAAVLFKVITLFFIFVFLIIISYENEHCSCTKKDVSVGHLFGQVAEAGIIPAAVSLVYILFLFYHNNRNTSLVQYLAGAAVFVINFSAFYLSEKMRENLKKISFLEQMKELYYVYKSYAEKLNQSLQTFRKLRHDLKKQYFLEQTYLEMGYYEKLKKEYERMYGKVSEQGQISGNVILDALLSLTEKKAKEASVDFQYQIRVPVDLNIEDYHMNCLLGNILENALEAADGNVRMSRHESKRDVQTTKDRTECSVQTANTSIRMGTAAERYIKLKLQYKQGNLFIRCENSCQRMIQSDMKTTKPDKYNHGLGLRIIKETAAFYHGQLETKMAGNVFVIWVMLFGVGQYETK